MTTLFIFLKEFIFASFWTCWVASFIEAGKSLAEAANSLGIFFLSISLLEVPTGFLADKFGKKLSSVSGILFVSIGFFINGTNPSERTGFLAFGLAGLGFTLMSGASTAWLYTLAKKEGLFQHEGFFLRVEMIGRLATITGSIISVYLLQLSATWMWWGIASIGFIDFLLGLRLPNDRDPGHIELPSLRIIADSIHNLKVPAIFWLTIASIFFGVESSIRNLIYQPYVVSLNSGNIWYLAVFQSSLAISRLAGITFYKNKLVSLDKSILLAAFSMVTFAVAEFVAAKTSSFAVFLSIYTFAIFTLGWYFPIKDSHFNRYLSDHTRATVLSINSMTENVFSAIGCFILSMKISVVPINQFWSYGGWFLLFTAIAVFMSNQQKKTLTDSLQQKRL